jgi:PAS domain S-box-containing protein
MLRHSSTYLLQIIVIAAASFATGRAGLLLALPPEHKATAVWLPSGIALAAVLLGGYRLWPGIWLGAFLLNFWDFFSPLNRFSLAQHAFVSSTIAVGSSLQALIGAALVRGLTGRQNPFDRAQDVFAFVACSLASCLIACTAGATSLCVSGLAPWPAYGVTWWTWWLGDLGGILLMTPLLVVWWQRRGIGWRRGWVAEAGVLFGLLFVVGQFVFGGWVRSGAAHYPLTFLLLPFLVWAALRLGQRAAVTATFVAATFAIVGTMRGIGPFVVGAVPESLLMLQTFVAAGIVTALPLGAAIRERQTTEAQLRELNAALEQRVIERSVTAEQRASELAASQSALHEEKVLLQLILSNMSSGVVVADTTGRFLLFNPAAERMLGMGATEIPLQSWPQHYGTFLSDRVTPFPYEQLPLVRAIRGESVDEVEVFIRHPIRPDGLWIRATGRPLREEGGALRGGLVVFGNITDQRRAEDALRASQARLAGILDIAEDAIISANADQRIILFNQGAERTFGYAAGEVFGQAIEQLLPERFRVAHRQHMAEFARSPSIARRMGARREVFGVRKDGIEFPAEASISRLDTPEGPVFTVILRDVTERRRAEAEIRSLTADLERRVRDRTTELEIANRELEAFCYSVSHDLRAPLRAIDGFSQALLEDYLSHLNAKGQEYLQRVRAASQRMAQLIDDLLQLSRLTRGALRRQEVDLSGLARTVAEDLRLQEPERHVEFASADGVTASADPALMRVVFDNLLGNAWKFTSRKEPARIEFGVSEHEGQPVYFVRDNGAGFDMSHAGKLFGAFQRLHAASAFPGTGIGLATVQRIIHRHGGSVWAEGAVEQGAAFYFTLRGPETRS